MLFDKNKILNRFMIQERDVGICYLAIFHVIDLCEAINAQEDVQSMSEQLDVLYEAGVGWTDMVTYIYAMAVIIRKYEIGDQIKELVLLDEKRAKKYVESFMMGLKAVLTFDKIQAPLALNVQLMRDGQQLM